MQVLQVGYYSYLIDLVPIFHDVGDAFGDGMSSVVLTRKLAETGSRDAYEYRFAKVSQLHITLVHWLIFSKGTTMAIHSHHCHQ